MPKENRPPPSSFIQSVPIRRADLAGIAARVPAPVSEKKPPPRMIFEGEEELTLAPPAVSRPSETILPAAAMSINVPQCTLPAADEPVMASGRDERGTASAVERWPTAEVVARVIVEACRCVQEDPIAIVERGALPKASWARALAFACLGIRYPELREFQLVKLLGAKATMPALQGIHRVLQDQHMMVDSHLATLEKTVFE